MPNLDGKLKPHQLGTAKGQKYGTQATEESRDKRWLFDTGGNISILSKSNADHFELTTPTRYPETWPDPKLAGQPFPGPGPMEIPSGAAGGGIPIRHGVRMCFAVESADGTTQKEVCCDLPVAVADVDYDTIGNDQLKLVGAKILWDPVVGSGSLRERDGGGKPGNLGPSSAIKNSLKPFQKGKATGRKHGRSVFKIKNWMIDTATEFSCITKSNAKWFDLELVAASREGAGPGAAEKGYKEYRGITMHFEILGRDGKPKQVSCSLPVMVKRSGSDIIGMDQLRKVNAMIEWDPTSRTGNLIERPKKEDGTPAAPVQKLQPDRSVKLRRDRRIRVVRSSNDNIVGVAAGTASPNEFTIRGLRVGGPVDVTVSYVDGTSEVIKVLVERANKV
ncbi:MAG: hypothetical protein JNL10_01470 [Verrucomicrobiales bacterium]|nr:hypothetical protein [Verrucomicrobiales bacterium]